MLAFNAFGTKEIVVYVIVVVIVLALIGWYLMRGAPRPSIHASRIVAAAAPLLGNAASATTGLGDLIG